MADWEPELYNRFRRYRAEPFELILTRLMVQPADTIVDLGCGDGANTIALARLAVRGRVTGIDSSTAMIARASALHAELPADLRARLRFIKADFRALANQRAYTVVFSNAALQWSPDHHEILARWYRALAPGGRMVVQMPANHEETAQTALRELADETRWRGYVGELTTPSHTVGTPDGYRTMLLALGMADVECYYHVFHHPMANPAAIVEFSRATALRPFLDRIPAARHAEFIGDYTRRLEAAYGTCGPLIFDFRRLFLWGRRADI